MKKLLFTFAASLALMFSLQTMSFANTAEMTEPTITLKPLVLPAAGRACLPEKGRMLRLNGRTEAEVPCHCPPENLCPQTWREWKTAPRLPHLIAEACCVAPKQCAFEKITTVSCGQQNTMTSDEKPFCYKYELSSDNRKSEEFIKFDKKVKVINEEFNKLRIRLSDLSRQNDTTGRTYEEALVILPLIDAQTQLAAKLKIEIENFNKTCDECNKNKKIEMTCGQEDEVVLCKKVFSARCGGDCVTAGTLIEMADGSKKVIEEVRVGEMIKGYNSLNKVVAMSTEDPDKEQLVSINDDKLIVTFGHPILTNNGWRVYDPMAMDQNDLFTKDVKKLEVGDEMFIPGEDSVKVTSIRPYVGPKKSTYNLSVGGDFTYIANGIVVRAYKANAQRY